MRAISECMWRLFPAACGRYWSARITALIFFADLWINERNQRFTWWQWLVWMTCTGALFLSFSKLPISVRYKAGGE